MSMSKGRKVSISIKAIGTYKSTLASKCLQFLKLLMNFAYLKQ